jgi:hypothetical protein
MTRKKARKSSTVVRRKGRIAANSGNVHLEALALELFSVVRNTLAHHGLGPTQQKLLFQHSLRLRHAPKVSASLLAQFRALADLLAAWHGEVPYLDSDGKPRVLNIKGRGATFESLARQFLPNKALADVVALACRVADVGTLPGDRIALYGDIMVNFSGNAESALAQAIYHATQVFNTGMHNVARTRADGTGRRLERTVHRTIVASDFDKLQSAIRPQVHDLCDRMERLLRSSAKSGKAKQKLGTAGMGVYLYYDDSPS